MIGSGVEGCPDGIAAAGAGSGNEIDGGATPPGCEDGDESVDGNEIDGGVTPPVADSDDGVEIAGAVTPPGTPAELALCTKGPGGMCEGEVCGMSGAAMSSEPPAPPRSADRGPGEAGVSIDTPSWIGPVASSAVDIDGADELGGAGGGGAGAGLGGWSGADGGAVGAGAGTG